MNYGDVLIDGKSYRVDLASYNGRDIVDFSPRGSVPGAATVMSDLSLYQPLVQTDWRHGYGFHWYSDASGYLKTVGNIDTRQDGLAMMFTQSVLSDSDNHQKIGFTVFNGKLYSWGTNGVREFNGTTWSDITLLAGTSVNYLLSAGDYLFICVSGARLQKMNKSNVVSYAGLDANAANFAWLIIHNGFIYGGIAGTNQIHYDDQVDLATMEGSTADPDTIYANISNMSTLGAIVYNANLYVSRPDGLWMIGDDNKARRVLDFSAELSDSNFRSMAIINGLLVFPIRDQIYQWNGARVANITPNRITDTYPYIIYGRFDHFMATDDFLFFVGRTNETLYTESLLCWDGAGTHKLCDLLTSTTDSITAMGYDAVNNYLWYHLDSTADKTYYIQFQNGATFPYANFPTTGQHSLITSRLDMGFRRITKSVPSIWVEARNVSSTRYIRVYYSLDGADWILWGDATQEGMNELTAPGGQQTVEFNYMILRFDFITDVAAQSPILESYTLRFIMRPETKMGYSMDVIVATDAQMDDELHTDERTSAQIKQDLRDLRNSKSPVEFVGLIGETILGYVSAIRERPVFRNGMSDGDEPYVEYIVNISLVEVGNA